MTVKNNFPSFRLTWFAFAFENEPSLSAPSPTRRARFPGAVSLNAGRCCSRWLCWLRLASPGRQPYTPKPLNQSPWRSAEGSIQNERSCREYNSPVFMSQAGLAEFGSFYGAIMRNSKAAAVLPSALCDPVHLQRVDSWIGTIKCTLFLILPTTRNSCLSVGKCVAQHRYCSRVYTLRKF